ncbi:MAG: HAD family hydrolase [Desulforhopalus sp.]|nr:HAD family hydrolase [Desulforhopalus sp.]
MLKLIVFDCDGVMFDSREANCMYYNHLLHHFGLPLMSKIEEEFVHMNSVNDSVRQIFSHYQEPTLEAVHAFRRQGDYSAFLPYMKMEPDLILFLEETKERYNLAISTNRTTTMIPLLRSYNIEDYFGKVMTADAVARPKPAPDALLEILKHFDCQPDEAIFIGDSIIDEQHAASCNVPLVAFRNRNLRALYHVDCFLDILRLPPLQ